MFYNVFTGIYKDISLTVKKPFKSKDIKITEEKSSKVIYVIEADKSLYIKENTDLRNINEIKNYYEIVLKEKFGEEIIYDIHYQNGTVEILIVKDFNINQNFYMIDNEILSLERVFKFLTDEDGYIFNLEKEKITFISIKNKEVEFYRVLNCDLEDIFNQIPKLNSSKAVLLAGNHKIDEFKSLLKDFKLIRNPYCDEGKTVAFGGALKGILNDRKLSFIKSQLSEKEIKQYIKIGTLILGLYFGAYIFMDKVFENNIKELKKLQTVEFKKYFPDIPVVSPYMQVKSMASTDINFYLSEKLSKINLPKNSKIYSVEYFEGILTIKGESSEPPQLAKSIKKTPFGNFEFEIEIK